MFQHFENKSIGLSFRIISVYVSNVARFINEWLLLFY